MTTLEVRGATRVFRGGAGAHEIELAVDPGEIHALVGLDGAGKSTLLRLVLGMLRPTTGELRRMRVLPGTEGEVVTDAFIALSA